jgi:hypothetical protein
MADFIPSMWLRESNFSSSFQLIIRNPHEVIVGETKDVWGWLAETSPTSPGLYWLRFFYQLYIDASRAYALERFMPRIAANNHPILRAPVITCTSVEKAVDPIPNG